MWPWAPLEITPFLVFLPPEVDLERKFYPSSLGLGAVPVA